jgi:hypothetical protein
VFDIGKGIFLIIVDAVRIGVGIAAGGGCATDPGGQVDGDRDIGVVVPSGVFSGPAVQRIGTIITDQVIITGATV